MVLKKIYFDSFKSLVDESLEISDSCIGIVGINESGKSNILKAIRVLKTVGILNSTFSPKITKKNPKLRFLFQLSKVERDECNKLLGGWISTNSILKSNIDDYKYDIEYVIEYDLDEKKENRTFNLINNYTSNKDILVLKEEYLNDDFKILYQNNFKPLQEALIIDKGELSNVIDNQNKFNQDQSKILSRIREINKRSEDINKILKDKPEASHTALKKELSGYESELSDLYEKRDTIAELTKSYNYNELVKDTEKLISKAKGAISDEKKQVDRLNLNVNSLKVKGELSTGEKSALTRYENNLSDAEKNLKILKGNLNKYQINLKNLETPLKDKYSNNKELIGLYFSRIIEDNLKNYIPKVIFWENSKDYILKSNTKFEDILKNNKTGDVPRPLFNVFRIGLNINTLDELKNKISIIQEDIDERSRIEDQLNENLNDHIKEIWKNYDQDVKVSLEEHQIKIQFYDPKTKSRSYFSLAEKSQGAQTFISFLMTIGAESAKGKLQNTILLLDEPEIHLHPSGVRYMLQELIRISRKQNIVIYATHSIFMIDRKKYERHVYLKKHNEKTKIHPSQIDRIGFFMQEEVLHEALNIDLDRDFRTTNKYNFVFEGDGDVFLFKEFYSKVLEEKDRPLNLKNSTFYQGGKCSDIQDYLKKSPIQLGTKWLFFLDNDKPADNLKTFISGKYKDYIDKDIFIYQYANEDKIQQSVELEDLMSKEFILSVYKLLFEEIGITIEKSVLDSVDFDKSNFSIYHNDIMSSTNLNKAEKQKVKERFKNIFNNEIRISLNKIKDQNDFKNTFSIYKAWIDAAVTDLKSKIKKNN